MNPDVIEGNALASRNGESVEEMLFDLFNITKVGGIVDGTLKNGLPIEIKSCQYWITDNSTASGFRIGRYRFNTRQHDYLVENGGFYLLVVMAGDDIFCSTLIHANKILISSTRTQLGWAYLFDYLNKNKTSGYRLVE